MVNRLEQIADNKRKAAIAKQDSDVERFAQKVADQVLSQARFTHSTDEIQEIVSGLSTAVAGAIVLSGETTDTKLDDNFSKLLLAVRENQPDATQIELSLQIGEQLARLETAFRSIELSPTINLEAVTADEIRAEVSRIVSLLPKDSHRIVTIAYENASPDKYINARLTDGISFYRAGGGAVITGGGASGGLTDEELRASPVPVLASIDTTGLATDTNQTTIIGHVDGIETLIGTTNTKLDTLTSTLQTVTTKATDAYSICAISEDSTYKYFFFEDATLNYYVMRKHKTNQTFDYTRGTGGYATVYVNSTSAPSGSPVYASYGNTF